MNNKLPDFVKNKYVYVLILIIFCGLLYLPSTVNRDLHYRDELRYVEIAKEMLETGQWLVPHFGGEIYSDKPPVYFWLLNFFRKIFGDYSTLAMVLPSALSAIIIVLLTYYLGSIILDRRYAFIAGLILATSFLFFGLSIFVRMDMLMIVFITASLLSFYLGYINEGKLKERYYLLVFLFMGLATVVKGPAGFLDPLLTIPGFLLLEGNLAELKKMKPARGFAIFLAVVLLWIIPAVIAGGKEYAYQLLIVQTLGRSVNSFAHDRPFYYYLITFPVTFLPWSLFLISGFIYSLKNRAKLPPEVKFLLAWFWMPFLLFSLISGKLDIYLLPIYPAASLLTGYLFKMVIKKKARQKYLVVPVVLTFLLLMVGGLALPETAEGVAVSSLLRPAVITFLLAGVAGFIALFKKKYILIPYLLVFMIFVFLLNFSLSVVPPLSQGYTKEPIANRIKVLREEENLTNIIAYRYGQPESLAVYTDFYIHDIGSEEQLIAYLKEKERVLVLMGEEDWDKLKGKLPGGTEVIYSSNDYLLVYHE